MDIKYLPKTFRGKMARLDEECAEVIQANAKARRHGFFNRSPITGVLNYQKILDELQDLKHAISIAERALVDAVIRRDVSRTKSHAP